MLTLRVLSALLSYPAPELKAQLAEAERILRSEKLLEPQYLNSVCAFLRHLRDTPQFGAESAYLDAFDRGAYFRIGIVAERVRNIDDDTQTLRARAAYDAHWRERGAGAGLFCRGQPSSGIAHAQAHAAVH